MAAARFQVVSVGRSAHVPVPRELDAGAGSWAEIPTPRERQEQNTTSGPTLTPPGTDVTPTSKPATSGATAPVVAERRTPALSAPAVGGLLGALIVCGGVAATLAPVTRFFGAARSNETGEGGDVTDRTEAGSLPSWLAARLALLARRR